MASSNIYYVNDAGFDRVTMQNKMPVLVDFYADWCGPCRTLSSIIEKVADLYEGKVAVCKMNVDESPYAARKYRVEAIPTVILFIDGLAAEKAVGLHDVDFYKSMLDKHLNKPEVESQIVLNDEIDNESSGNNQ